MGRLIAIEGLDGSGKGTQTELLYKRFTKNNIKSCMVSFPDYESPSSALVNMYLGGEFGNQPEDVNGYAASAFFAVDRFASFKTKWKDNYDNGEIILCNRYTTSNLFHQMVKLPREEWDTFIEWLNDFEYVKLGLPKPDAVIYFDMDPDISQRLLAGRYHGDNNKKDIHEKNVEYIKACRETALYAAEKLGWVVIKCFEGENPLPIESIENTALEAVRKVIGVAI